MKKSLIMVTLLCVFEQLHTYDVYVMNDTVKPVKVELSKGKGCAREPNHGDMLPEKTEYHWPVHSDCWTKITFTFPDNTQGEVTAKPFNKHFVITSKIARDSQGNPIKDSNGEDKIIYNWEDR